MEELIILAFGNEILLIPIATLELHYPISCWGSYEVQFGISYFCASGIQIEKRKLSLQF
jgi:hypothetical protein